MPIIPASTGQRRFPRTPLGRLAASRIAPSVRVFPDCGHPDGGPAAGVRPAVLFSPLPGGRLLRAGFLRAGFLRAGFLRGPLLGGPLLGGPLLGGPLLGGPLLGGRCSAVVCFQAVYVRPVCVRPVCVRPVCSWPLRFGSVCCWRGPSGRQRPPTP